MAMQIPGSGWRVVSVVEPALLNRNPRRCVRCEQWQEIAHLLENPHSRQHVIACASCAASLVPGYDARGAERRAIAYLDRELRFLTPRLWRPVRGRKYDTERWVVIGGLKWLVQVRRLRANCYSASVQSERDPEAKATCGTTAETVELGKRIAFKSVNYMRGVIRSTGHNEPTGEELDGVEG